MTTYLDARLTDQSPGVEAAKSGSQAEGGGDRLEKVEMDSKGDVRDEDAQSPLGREEEAHEEEASDQHPIIGREGAEGGGVGGAAGRT